MTFYFNPSHRNYRQLKELFEQLGNDYEVSWNDSQEANGSYIFDIVITARKVGR